MLGYIPVDALTASFFPLYVCLVGFFVVLVLFLLGGEVIHTFAFAMIVGVIVGTYSSIFIASPIIVKMASSHSKEKNN